jgi:hypothetical protein
MKKKLIDFQEDLHFIKILDNRELLASIELNEKLKKELDEEFHKILQNSFDLNFENPLNFLLFEGFPFFEVLCVLAICSSSFLFYFLLKKNNFLNFKPFKRV